MARFSLPADFRFTDVEAERLARDEGEPAAPPAPMPAGQWQAYLARLLPPVAADPPERAGSPALLRTEAGMADFLASLGAEPACTLARSLAAIDRSGFWHGVRRELAVIGAA